jgi:DNA-directed RNA polymerase subunit RPC12/RpoP
MKRIRIVNSETLPVCPHCEKSLSAIERVKGLGPRSDSSIYICAECKKVIGIGEWELQ